MSDEQNTQNEQPVFGIQKIYVKDLSLEVPNAPAVFFEQETPQVQIELRNDAQPVAEGLYENTLTVTATATIGEDKTVFLVEVAQSGLFEIRNVPEEELDPILGIACPNILFPYAREVISDMTTRAGFTPFLLSPVNFEALYYQSLLEKQQGQQEGTNSVA